MQGHYRLQYKHPVSCLVVNSFDMKTLIATSGAMVVGYNFDHMNEVRLA